MTPTRGSTLSWVYDRERLWNQVVTSELAKWLDNVHPRNVSCCPLWCIDRKERTPMETRTVHYQNRDQLERGIERLEAEGWTLQTVTEIVGATPGEDTIRAEFRRSEGSREESQVTT